MTPLSQHQREIERNRQSWQRKPLLQAVYAGFYQRIAERFADSRSELAFWLSRALAESNLTNLLAFLQHQLDDRDFPEGVVDAIAQTQQDTDVALSAAERELEHDSTTRDDMYRHVVELLSTTNIEALARSIGHLFPVMPVAMAALRDFLLGTVQDVTAWVELHTHDPALRERTAQLRAAVAPPMCETAAIVVLRNSSSLTLRPIYLSPRLPVIRCLLA